jgi:hypothetical protein
MNEQSMTLGAFRCRLSYFFYEAREFLYESRRLAEEIIGESASLARPDAGEVGEDLF